MKRRLAVLGAGVMGTAIATLAVGHGLPVTLVETDPDRLAGAAGKVTRQLRFARMMGHLPRTAPDGELTVVESVVDVAEATAVVESGALLEAKVRDGEHGRKSGRGFFEHGGVR
jgi:methoxymalonate biosynthesis protein